MDHYKKSSDDWVFCIAYLIGVFLTMAGIGLVFGYPFVLLVSGILIIIHAFAYYSNKKGGY
jgi:hypothetical protein